MRHQYAGVENARPENAAPDCRGWKMQDWKMQETTLYGTPHIAYVYFVLQEANVE